MNSFKWIVYLTTNLINQHIYVGVHKTINPDIFDGYIGNGIYITKPATYQYSKTIFQAAVKKYGPKNFRRETLAIFDNEDEAYLLEEEIVNEEFLTREDVYNMVLGGGGGVLFEGTPCHKYSLEGKYIESYKSFAEAAVLNGKGATTVKRAAKINIRCGDWFFYTRKVDQLDLSKYNTNFKKTVIVYQYSNMGDYETMYNSIKEAANANNCSSTSIREALIVGTLCKDKYFSYTLNKKFCDAKLQQLRQCPVYTYDIYGNYLGCFGNVLETSKYLKIRGDIFSFVRFKRPYYNKYQFTFEQLSKLSDRSTKKQHAYIVDQYDTDGNFIKTWQSARQCQKATGISEAGIRKCIKGKQKTAGGYIFKLHSYDEVKDIV